MNSLFLKVYRYNFLKIINDCLYCLAGWVNTSSISEISISFSKMKKHSNDGMKVNLFLEIESDLSWHVYAKGKEISLNSHFISLILSASLSLKIHSISDILSIMHTLDECNFCICNDDDRYKPF